MRASRWRNFLLAILALPVVLSQLSAAVAASEAVGISPHFPKPSALHANVEFWKRIYTEFGVGDFVLHDRDNLYVIYDVVQVNGTTNERRAEELAKPEVERTRERYEGILVSLAQSTPAQDLGLEARWVDQAWGCPCPPENLLRAAANIRVQQGVREKVEEGMQRARGLLPRILSILRRHNVPDELAALPLVESAFNPQARSRAGAVGLWQFVASTGKRYLTITHGRDDRRDPIRATEAAARLLRKNYEALGSWPLALMAYHHGMEGVLAARAAVGSDAIEEIIARYSGPRFGFASKNFYAEYLAALEVFHPTIREHAQQPPRPTRQSPIVRKG
ncbi:MAG: lytic transglycosylase domain-containing protein [Candidatus Methylomirabilota bacterium]